ncbi:hypothetical protein ACP70R_039813 [Stipagrostis hirtigluma subsp. patula]
MRRLLKLNPLRAKPRGRTINPHLHRLMSSIRAVLLKPAPEAEPDDTCLPRSIDQTKRARLGLCHGTEITMSWSDLRADLVTAIAGRFTDLADLSSFRSVCPSWRSASAAHAARRRVPLLLVPNGDHRTGFNHGVWSLTDDRLREIPLLSACNFPYIFASHNGWMLVVKYNLSVTLVHPSAGGSADLPMVPGWFHGDIEERLGDMAWDRSSHGVVVSMPYMGVFFCRPGDRSWRPIVGCSCAFVTSVTYCDGAFFLLAGRKVMVVDAGTMAVAAVIEPPPAVKATPGWLYKISLVVSPDEFLLVRTPLHYSVSNGLRVKVFRASRAGTSWSEVDGIGGRAVFVDHVRAFCVEANVLNGLKGNCVYVAARSYEEVQDEYGTMSVNGRYTVSMHDIADDLTTVDLSLKKEVTVWSNMFWQWPSWLWPSPG